MSDQPAEQPERPGPGEPRRAAGERRVFRREIDCAPEGRGWALQRGADERRAGERWPIPTDPAD